MELCQRRRHPEGTNECLWMEMTKIKYDFGSEWSRVIISRYLWENWIRYMNNVEEYPYYFAGKETKVGRFTYPRCDIYVVDTDDHTVTVECGSDAGVITVE